MLDHPSTSQKSFDTSDVILLDTLCSLNVENLMLDMHLDLCPHGQNRIMSTRTKHRSGCGIDAFTMERAVYPCRLEQGLFPIPQGSNWPESK